MNRKRILIGVAMAVLATWIILCQVVIKAAEDYYPGPDIACATVMTPAIHIPTGAWHVFSSGCLPPGWVSL